MIAAAFGALLMLVSEIVPIERGALQFHVAYANFLPFLECFNSVGERNVHSTASMMEDRAFGGLISDAIYQSDCSIYRNCIDSVGVARWLDEIVLQPDHLAWRGCVYSNDIEAIWLSWEDNIGSCSWIKISKQSPRCIVANVREQFTRSTKFEHFVSHYFSLGYNVYSWQRAYIIKVEAKVCYQSTVLIDQRTLKPRDDPEPRSLLISHFVKLPLHDTLPTAHGQKLQDSSDEEQSSEEANNARPPNQVLIRAIFGWIGILVAAILSSAGGLCFAVYDNWRGWLALTAGVAGAVLFACQSAPLIGLG